MPFLLNNLSLASTYTSVSDITSSLELNLFLWSILLRSANSHWKPDLQNSMGVEAIRSAVHVVLPSLWSTYDTVHCLGERALFSSSFVQKLFFFCFEIVANNALNCWRIVVFDRPWANFAPTLNTAFSSTNVHAKWWIHCLLISSTPLLSHATSIYNRPKQVSGDFWCFPGQLSNFDNLSIQHHLCLYEHV